MHELMKTLQGLAINHGASLTCAASFRPMSIEMSAKSEFSRGVLASIAEVYVLAAQTSEGRQAILDLGFEPFFQHVEGE